MYDKGWVDLPQDTRPKGYDTGVVGLVQTGRTDLERGTGAPREDYRDLRGEVQDVSPYRVHLQSREVVDSSVLSLGATTSVVVGPWGSVEENEWRGL